MRRGQVHTNPFFLYFLSINVKLVLHFPGRLLVSGSDDMNIVVWEWAKNVALQTIKTGHKSNIFQSKFLHLNAQSQLNIVTCARDGQVMFFARLREGSFLNSMSNFFFIVCMQFILYKF